jgi:signal transduction histidine kinase
MQGKQVLINSHALSAQGVRPRFPDPQTSFVSDMSYSQWLDRRLYGFLTKITRSEGAFGFNRALILVADGKFFVSGSEVAPRTKREAERRWELLAGTTLSRNETIDFNIAQGKISEPFPGRIPIDNSNYVGTLAIEKRPELITEQKARELIAHGDEIIEALVKHYDFKDFIVMPVRNSGTNGPVALIIADRAFVPKPLVDRDLDLLVEEAHELGAMLREKVVRRRLRELMETLTDAMRTPLIAVGGIARQQMRILSCRESMDKADIAELMTSLGNVMSIVEAADGKVKDIERMLSEELGTAPQKVAAKPLNLVLEALDAAFLGLGSSKRAFKRNVPDSLPDVLVDKDALINLVFGEFIRNAVKHTKEGGFVEISAVREGDFIRFTIRDTGEGIPPENLKQVFEPFFTTKEGGQGVGLPIVRNVVRNHGGDLGVESELGKGASFWFTLPTIK